MFFAISDDLRHNRIYHRIRETRASGRQIDATMEGKQKKRLESAVAFNDQIISAFGEQVEPMVFIALNKSIHWIKRDDKSEKTVFISPASH